MKEKVENIEVAVHWKAFFLNDSLPPAGDGVKLADYLREKYGIANYNHQTSPVTKAGEACGISFHENRMLWHTLQAHRLLELAREQGGDKGLDIAMEKLFSEYFEKAQNISDPDFLERVGRELDLDGDLESYFGGDEIQKNSDAVVDQVMTARRMGIHAVPFFVFRIRGTTLRPVGFSGAQPAEVMEDAMQEMLDRAAR